MGDDHDDDIQMLGNVLYLFYSYKSFKLGFLMFWVLKMLKVAKMIFSNVLMTYNIRKHNFNDF